MVRPVRNVFGGKEESGLRMNSTETFIPFYLWIDGVGGYLVCPQEVVTVGGVEAEKADVLLSGDLLPIHARFFREGEGYVLEAVGAVRVDGRPAVHTVLPDGCSLELGSCVRLTFTRPHPWSLSARLDFASGHRTVPATDGVLLFARNLLLGPDRRSHVVCPQWADGLLIYRDHGGLRCRSRGLLRIDGKVVRGEGFLSLTSCVEMSRGRFHLEPASR